MREGLRQECEQLLEVEEGEGKYVLLEPPEGIQSCQLN